MLRLGVILFLAFIFASPSPSFARERIPLICKSITGKIADGLPSAYEDLDKALKGVDNDKLHSLIRDIFTTTEGVSLSISRLAKKITKPKTSIAATTALILANSLPHKAAGKATAPDFLRDLLERIRHRASSKHYQENVSTWKTTLDMLETFRDSTRALDHEIWRLKEDLDTLHKWKVLNDTQLRKLQNLLSGKAKEKDLLSEADARLYFTAIEAVSFESLNHLDLHTPMDDRPQKPDISFSYAPEVGQSLFYLIPNLEAIYRGRVWATAHKLIDEARSKLEDDVYADWADRSKANLERYEFLKRR